MLSAPGLRGRATGAAAVKGRGSTVDTSPVSMRRAASLLTLALTMLMLASPASARASETARSPELRHLDRRIDTAERRIDTWNRRVDHWHRRIARAAVAVDRLTDRAEGDVPVILEGVMHGFPTRELDTHRLARAHRFLRSVLKARVGRRGPQELSAWAAVLSELQRERDALLHRDSGDGGKRAAPGPHGPVTYEGWAHGFLDRLSAPSCSENLLDRRGLGDIGVDRGGVQSVGDDPRDGGRHRLQQRRRQELPLARTKASTPRATRCWAVPSPTGTTRSCDSLQACAPAASTASAINASAWCRGCTGGTYLTGLLPIVRADYADARRSPDLADRQGLNVHPAAAGLDAFDLCHRCVDLPRWASVDLQTEPDAPSVDPGRIRPYRLMRRAAPERREAPHAFAKAYLRRLSDDEIAEAGSRGALRPRHLDVRASPTSAARSPRPCGCSTPPRGRGRLHRRRHGDRDEHRRFAVPGRLRATRSSSRANLTVTPPAAPGGRHDPRRGGPDRARPVGPRRQPPRVGDALRARPPAVRRRAGRPAATGFERSCATSGSWCATSSRCRSASTT